MKKAPNLWNLADLPGMRPVAKTVPTMADIDANIDGAWVPARPLGCYLLAWRLKLAWMVFIGKADALLWPHGQ